MICFQHTIERNTHCHSKMEESGYSEEILDQNKTKTQQGTFEKLYVYVSCQNLDGSILPALLTTTFFFLGLVPEFLVSECSFPWQITHGSNIPNIPGSPM